MTLQRYFLLALARPFYLHFQVHFFQNSLKVKDVWNMKKNVDEFDKFGWVMIVYHVEYRKFYLRDKHRG